jgi:hypothetical protein
MNLLTKLMPTHAALALETEQFMKTQIRTPKANCAGVKERESTHWTTERTMAVLKEISMERQRKDALLVNCPDQAFYNGLCLHSLRIESFMEKSREALRHELIQLAAVACAWVESIPAAEVES